MRKVFATTSNVKRLVEAMGRLVVRDWSVPGMGLLFGEPGLGKTKSAAGGRRETTEYSSGPRS